MSIKTGIGLCSVVGFDIGSIESEFQLLDIHSFSKFGHHMNCGTIEF